MLELGLVFSLLFLLKRLLWLASKQQLYCDASFDDGSKKWTEDNFGWLSLTNDLLLFQEMSSIFFMISILHFVDFFYHSLCYDSDQLLSIMIFLYSIVTFFSWAISTVKSSKLCIIIHNFKVY